MATAAIFVPATVPECPYAPRMTRADALALRAAGGLRENCVVVITDGPVIGTAGNTSPTEIELNPTGPSELGLTARVHTTFAASAWPGTFDIDLGAAGSITQLTDDWGNTAKDVDADSPTVHGQFPWHLGGAVLRDNYVEDATLPGWDTQIGSMIGNRVVASTVDLTARTSGVLNESEFAGTTVVSGASFSATRSAVNGGTITAAGTGNVSLTRSQITNATLVQGAGATGGITVTDSTLDAAILNVDPGSAKLISITASELLGYSIRTQDATAASASLVRCNAYGKPNAATADSLLVHGSGGVGAGVIFSNCTIDGFSLAGAGLASFEVNAPQAGALINDADIRNSRITVGPGAGSFQSTGAEFNGATINALGPGPNGRLTINRTSVTGATITHGLLATEALTIADGHVESGGLIELLSGARGLSVTDTDVRGAAIIRQTTVNAAAAPNSNQVTSCRVLDQGRVIFSETVAAGQLASSVNRSTIKSNSLGAGVDGVLTITGDSAQVVVDDCDLEGIVTLTDVPAGALSAGTAFHNNRVGPASTLTYTGGDATAKQIRSVTVEDVSTLTITNLTGSAGAGLGDVFAGLIRGQSVMTVTGARVAGQPVRNFTVADGSTLNVAANGTVLQCQFRAGATLNTAAFRHSESVIEGSFTKTATAANVNRLCNKSFDDWL